MLTEEARELKKSVIKLYNGELLRRAKEINQEEEGLYEGIVLVKDEGIKA